MTRSEDVNSKSHRFLKASDSRCDQHILHSYESYTNIHSVKMIIGATDNKVLNDEKRGLLGF